MRLVLMAMMFAALSVAQPSAEQKRADQKPAELPDAGARAGAIQSVIERQIAAFLRNDLEGAFAFAAPNIRQRFGDPERFGQMVRSGYPMVWRPQHFEMLDLVKTPSGLVQVVLFQDGAGVLYEAGYLMELVDGAWRIAGVKIRRRPGVGT